MCLIRYLIFIGHLYLSGIWFDVAPRTNRASKEKWPSNTHLTYDMFLLHPQVCHGSDQRILKAHIILTTLQKNWTLNYLMSIS